MQAVTSVEISGLDVYSKGKVRDVYDLGDRLLMVASDRISAFDIVLPSGIPDKGKILTAMSAFWFRKLENVSKHHLISERIDAFVDAQRKGAEARRASGGPVQDIYRALLAIGGALPPLEEDVRAAEWVPRACEALEARLEAFRYEEEDEAGWGASTFHEMMRESGKMPGSQEPGGSSQ